MPKLKLHFDGWLTLPVAFRKKLHLEQGDELEAELVGGTIVLRPTTEGSRSSKRNPQHSDENVAAPTGSAAPAPVRKPPRQAALPIPPGARGRRKRP